jgi:hypothetical protein
LTARRADSGTAVRLARPAGVTLRLPDSTSFVPVLARCGRSKLTCRSYGADWHPARKPPPYTLRQDP